MKTFATKIRDLIPLLGRLLDVLWTVATGKFFLELCTVRRRMHEAFFSTNASERVSYRGNFPQVSVVIPTLNEADYLRNCLFSIRHGGYPNCEIIVVDGLSTDGTVDIARKMGARIIFSKSRSMSRLIHLGCLAARGEIILKTDADTIFPTQTLYSVARAFTDFPNVQIYNIGHFYYDSGFLPNLIAHYYDKYWRKPWNTSGHFIAFRRNVLQLIHFRKEYDGYEDFAYGNDVFRAFGRNSILYDPNAYVLISARSIKKHGLLKHILKGGSSFKAAPPKDTN